MPATPDKARTAPSRALSTEPPCKPALRLTATTAGLRPSVLRGLIARAGEPGVLSLAIGMPTTELLPAGELAELAGSELSSRGGALQYGTPLGELREQIAELMLERGVSCSPGQVFLTHGAQQALRLVGRLYVDRGRPVALEESVYDGLQLAIGDLQPDYLPVSGDPETGIDLDALESLLATGRRPAFLYVVPEGHNPQGISLPVEHRHRLVELARRHGLLIVEDDACGFLDYEGGAPPALRSLDDGHVIYVGSFSKVLSPALRTGWMVVPEALIEPLTILKHGADLDTSTYAQHLIARFVAKGRLEAQLSRVRQANARRLAALLAALDGEMKDIAQWAAPRAGLYTWLRLDPRIDTFALLEEALDRDRVAFIPGIAFSPTGYSFGSNALRLSFANLESDEIHEAIQRLARAVRRFRSRL